MTRKVVVAGVGMIPFTKPGASLSYDLMGAQAARQALQDAGVQYPAIQQAYVGYIYGDSCCGQRALYPVGLSGIPLINVNNNCSSGSTALFLARQAIQSGAIDIALVLGFEQMTPGALASQYNDRPNAADPFIERCDALVGVAELPTALRIFGGAGLAQMQRFGTPPRKFREDPRQGQPARRAQPPGGIPQGSQRG